MSIDSNEIIKTAKLAKLNIKESDKDNITQRIAEILNLVDQMQSVDTSNIKPMANSHDAYQILRSDEAIIPNNPTQKRDDIQLCAPSIDKGLYLVPKVID
jgi:aspartyl-tRNA(Asn)/glutamyl-tRNA(Gln) amidotransferase subunit C